jgi:hypothetical protein
MTRVQRSAFTLVIVLAGGAGSACQLKRPDVIPARMIEPRLIDPEDETSSSASQSPRGKSAGAMAVRLLETQARAHIGRRLLHQETNGELVEDAAWHWSSAPARYLDSALRLVFSSSPNVRLVDSGNAITLAVTLITWHLESAERVQLVGAVELVVTHTDRSVRAHVIRGREPVSSEPPGDLAAAAGRLLRTLATASLTRATQPLDGNNPEVAGPP